MADAAALVLVVESDPDGPARHRGDPAPRRPRGGRGDRRGAGDQQGARRAAAADRHRDRDAAGRRLQALPAAAHQPGHPRDTLRLPDEQGDNHRRPGQVPAAGRRIPAQAGQGAGVPRARRRDPDARPGRAAGHRRPAAAPRHPHRDQPHGPAADPAHEPALRAARTGDGGAARHPVHQRGGDPRRRGRALPRGEGLLSHARVGGRQVRVPAAAGVGAPAHQAARGEPDPRGPAPARRGQQAARHARPPRHASASSSGASRARRSGSSP